MAEYRPERFEDPDADNFTVNLPIFGILGEQEAKVNLPYWNDAGEVHGSIDIINSPSYIFPPSGYTSQLPLDVDITIAGVLPSANPYGFNRPYATGRELFTKDTNIGDVPDNKWITHRSGTPFITNDGPTNHAAFIGNESGYINLTDKIPTTISESFFGISFWFEWHILVSGERLMVLKQYNLGDDKGLLDIVYVKDPTYNKAHLEIYQYEDGGSATKGVKLDVDDLTYYHWYHLFIYIDYNDGNNGDINVYLNGVHKTRDAFNNSTRTSFPQDATDWLIGANRLLDGGNSWSNTPSMAISNLYWSTNPAFQYFGYSYRNFPRIKFNGVDTGLSDHEMEIANPKVPIDGNSFYGTHTIEIENRYHDDEEDTNLNIHEPDIIMIENLTFDLVDDLFAPTDINLEQTNVYEDFIEDDYVSLVIVTDDQGPYADVSEITLVDDSLGAFKTDGKSILVGSSGLDHTLSPYTIRVRATDSTNLVYEKNVMINVLPKPEPPRNIVATPNEATTLELPVTTTVSGTGFFDRRLYSLHEGFKQSGSDAAALSWNNSTPVQSQVGKAFHGNGVDSYVDLSDRIPTLTNYLGVSFNINMSHESSFLAGAFVLYNSTTDQLIQFDYLPGLEGVPASGIAEFTARNTVGDPFTLLAYDFVDPNTWMNIFISYDKDLLELKLYMNGVHIPTGNVLVVEEVDLSGFDKLFIGRSRDAVDSYSKSHISDFYISNDKQFKNLVSRYNEIPRVEI